MHVLLGPNGSGKTTLIMTIMGYPEYKITKGQILFNGEDIAELDITERVKLGIGISQQRPLPSRRSNCNRLLTLLFRMVVKVPKE